MICLSELRYKNGYYMRLLKANKKLLGMIMAIVMIFGMAVPASASSTISKRASSKMSVYVTDESYALSNSVSFKFTSPNANAKSAKISLSLSSHSGDAVIIQYVILTAPLGNVYTITIASGNTGTVTFSPVEPIVGTWTAQAYCYCPSGIYGYGSSTFYPVTLTLTY